MNTAKPKEITSERTNKIPI